MKALLTGRSRMGMSILDRSEVAQRKLYTSLAIRARSYTHAGPRSLLPSLRMIHF